MVRSKEGRCAVVLSVMRSGIRWYYHFKQSVSHSFAVFHMFDALNGEDTDGSKVANGRFVQSCSSCQTIRVLQSAEPKEAVVQQLSWEFMSYEATERRFAVSGTIWMREEEESSSWSSCTNAFRACLTKKEVPTGKGQSRVPYSSSPLCRRGDYCFCCDIHLFILHHSLFENVFFR